MDLKTINLCVTNKCNMSCRHCVYSSGKQGIGELSYGEIKKIINEFADISRGNGVINIFGGEPFLRDDIFTIIDYAICLGLNMGVTTNANLSQEIIKKIASKKISRLTIDIDGADADSHEWLRNKKGHFNKILETIKFFIKSKKFTTANIVLHKKNIDEAEAILELCSKLKLNFVSFYLFTPLGRGKNIENLVIGPEEWKKARERVGNWADNNNPDFGIIWERSYEYINKEKNLPCVLCRGKPSDVIDIHYNGNVYYCGLLAAVDFGCLGNAKREPLSKIVSRRRDCAIKMKFGCPALAHAVNSKNLIDPRPHTSKIIPVCPYDWEVICGLGPNLKDKFAHIDLGSRQ